MWAPRCVSCTAQAAVYPTVAEQRYGSDYCTPDFGKFNTRMYAYLAPQHNNFGK
jgi:hypothetical protein